VGLSLAPLDYALEPGAGIPPFGHVLRLVVGDVHRQHLGGTGIGQTLFAGIHEGVHIELGVRTAFVLRAAHRLPAGIVNLGPVLFLHGL